MPHFSDLRGFPPTLLKWPSTLPRLTSTQAAAPPTATRANLQRRATRGCQLAPGHERQKAPELLLFTSLASSEIRVPGEPFQVRDTISSCSVPCAKSAPVFFLLYFSLVFFFSCPPNRFAVKVHTRTLFSPFQFNYQESTLLMVLKAINITKIVCLKQIPITTSYPIVVNTNLKNKPVFLQELAVVHVRRNILLTVRR